MQQACTSQSGCWGSPQSGCWLKVGLLLHLPLAKQTKLTHFSTTEEDASWQVARPRFNKLGAGSPPGCLLVLQMMRQRFRKLAGPMLHQMRSSCLLSAVTLGRVLRCALVILAAPVPWTVAGLRADTMMDRKLHTVSLSRIANGNLLATSAGNLQSRTCQLHCAATSSDAALF